MHPLVNDVMVVAWHLTMGKEQLKIFSVVTATIAKQSFIKIIIIVSKGLKNDMHLESYWNNSSTNFTSNHKLLTKHCQNLQYLIMKKKISLLMTITVFWFHIILLEDQNYNHCHCQHQSLIPLEFSTWQLLLQSNANHIFTGDCFDNRLMYLSEL